MSGVDKRVIDLYEEGIPMKGISLETGLPLADIIKNLQTFRKSQLFKGQYSDKLMMIVSSRDASGATRKDIMEELGVSRNFLERAIREYGFIKKSIDGDEEHFYMNASDGYEFLECPECESSRINNISGEYGEGNAENIYCMNCGSEFILKDNKIYIIKWEYID